MRNACLLALGWLVIACGDDAASSTDSGANAVDAAGVIIPDDPGAADIRVSVNTSNERRAISPFIYGVNQPEWTGRGRYMALARAGGNRYTAYNWENNASNAGADYMHQNDSYLGGGDTPGEVVRAVVADSHANDAAALITVPIVDHVAADKSPGGDVAGSPNYLDTRFHQNRPSKAGALTTSPDTGDGFVYQDEFVNFVETAFPYAQNDDRRRIFYSLDNEPDLWSDTHARIHPDPVRYDELISRNTDYAAAIKSVAPEAVVFGFVSYGWQGYVSLQDAPDASGRDFVDHYLSQMAQAEQQAGTRLVDVLDLHWYPEARGGGLRIIEDSAAADVAAARMDAPRSLWDDTYTETSWITEFSTLGPIALLPRMNDKIAAHYPGTRLSISEYYYGGGDHISGGVAQADVLGIFGRYDVFAAALWHIGNTNDDYIWAALNLYRNYDGAGARFGDTSVLTTTDDSATSSAYAAVDASSDDRVTIVLINKADERTAGIAVTHTRRFSRAQVYRITEGSADIDAGADVSITATNAFIYTMPARSVTLLVLRP